MEPETNAPAELTQKPKKPKSGNAGALAGTVIFIVAVVAVLYYAGAAEHDGVTLALLLFVLFVGEIFVALHWYSTFRSNSRLAAKRILMSEMEEKLLEFTDRQKGFFANIEETNRELQKKVENLDKTTSYIVSRLDEIAAGRVQMELTDFEIEQIATRSAEKVSALPEIKQTRKSDEGNDSAKLAAGAIVATGIAAKLESIEKRQDEILQKLADFEIPAEEEEFDEDAEDSGEEESGDESEEEIAENADDDDLAEPQEEESQDDDDSGEEEEESEDDDGGEEEEPVEEGEEEESEPEEEEEPAEEESNDNEEEAEGDSEDGGEEESGDNEEDGGEDSPDNDDDGGDNDPDTDDDGGEEEPTTEPEEEESQPEEEPATEPEPEPEPVPAPAEELPPAEDLPHTALILRAELGQGQKPYLRGNAPGISTKKSTPMEYSGNNRWRFDFGAMREDATITIFLNDTNEALGDPFTLPAGKVTQLAFEPQK